MVTTLGVLAAVVTTFQFLPQTRRTWQQRRDVEALSGIALPTFLLVVTSASLWVVYGILGDEWPVVFPNIVCLLSGLMTVWLVLAARRRGRVRPG